MDIVYSKHWIRKQKKKKKDITNDVIEYTIKNSQILKDKYWIGALNAISRVTSSGRRLKVVYKRIKEKIFIITAYWLD